MSGLLACCVLAVLVFSAWLTYELMIARPRREVNRRILATAIQQHLTAGECSALELSELVGISVHRLYPILHEGEKEGVFTSRSVPDTTGYRGGRDKKLYRVAVPKWIPPSEISHIL